MKKKYSVYTIVAIVVVIFAAAYSSSQKSPAQPTFDPLDATYTIGSQSVTLVGGKSSVPAAPGSATEVVTSAFGELAKGDLNGDGKQDAALMLVQDSGGSGTFYYVVVAINTADGAQGTNAVLLGDRIAPQDVEIQNGEVIANYADRKPGEPMSVEPSVGMSKYLMLQGDTLVDVSSSTQ